MPPGSLIVEDLVVERGPFRLGPISLRVDSGTALYLRGANGAGKSTLLAAIAGLVPLRQGRVRLGDRTLSSAETFVAPHARGIAVLLQDLGLWPHLTVRRQALLVAEAELAARALARLDELAAALGVAHLLDRKPQALSGGEAQRCALVRSLMRRDAALLLDEPCARQNADGARRVDAVIRSELARGAVVLVAGHLAPPGAREYELPSV
ncbi:MAG: ATP-binding cassette domain-containing protein [Planctomycetota bacterium]